MKGKYKKFYTRLFTLSYDPIGNSPRCEGLLSINFWRKPIVLLDNNIIVFITIQVQL